MFGMKTHLMLTTPEQTIPFFIECIGFNPEQETVIRHEGYGYYHWLQTVSGQGEIFLGDRSYLLPPNHGILLMPHVAHRYHMHGDRWSTCYLTFDGPQVAPFLSILGIRVSTVYCWSADTELEKVIEQALESALVTHDVTGLDNSIAVYRFLVKLKRHGRTDGAPSIQSLAERLTPLLHYLDAEYRNPDLGTADMADHVRISPRHLNSLFKKAFGFTPYQYLLNLRIRKAKELLGSKRSMSVQQIAEMTGFRNSSNFIATFRKHERITPDQYRQA
ncbi:helix-turn-helix transcriptional regulator [Paenibacillus ehimensis]|uniref:helix-turn-helix transcriptional regulator n=2 Tax=Paenibacillus ehimensis TaxID=79264 RepID=UPI000FDCCBDA|nr:AraC family transcriptional regulator [Paenibacillus ehimensis]MEC0210684.1 AraC family transcriptional regulator [Paenibacillus ehimensis]